MSKRVFTQEQEDYIKANYQTKSDKELAEFLCCDSDRVKRYRNNHGLKKYSCRTITKEERQFLLDHLDTMSYQELADAIGVTHHQIIGHLNYLGITKIGKYPCSYFHEIDTPEKAYWIGFIYADGTLQYVPEKRRYGFDMTLQSRDRYMLERLNSHFGNGGIWNDYETSDDILGYHRITTSQMSVLRLPRKELVEDLMSHNIFPRKTYREEFPIVKSEYFFDFLRGLNDGDGCILINSSRHNYPAMVIVNPNLKLFNYLKRILEGYEINSGISLRTDGHTYNFRLNGSYAMKALNEMYKDENCVKLERKYNQYLLAKEWLTFRENEK